MSSAYSMRPNHFFVLFFIAFVLMIVLGWSIKLFLWVISYLGYRLIRSLPILVGYHVFLNFLCNSHPLQVTLVYLTNRFLHNGYSDVYDAIFLRCQILFPSVSVSAMSVCLFLHFGKAFGWFLPNAWVCTVDSTHHYFSPCAALWIVPPAWLARCCILFARQRLPRKDLTEPFFLCCIP